MRFEESIHLRDGAMKLTLGARLKLAGDVLRDAQWHCPVGERAFEDEDGQHPGALRDSLEIDHDPETDEVFVGSNNSYAAYVEFGTAPHVIEDGWGRGIRINHPGTGATPFLRGAIRKTRVIESGR